MYHTKWLQSQLKVDNALWKKPLWTAGPADKTDTYYSLLEPLVKCCSVLDADFQLSGLGHGTGVSLQVQLLNSLTKMEAAWKKVEPVILSMPQLAVSAIRTHEQNELAARGHFNAEMLDASVQNAVSKCAELARLAAEISHLKDLVSRGANGGASGGGDSDAGDGTLCDSTGCYVVNGHLCSVPADFKTPNGKPTDLWRAVR